ncbi:hypothetical protein DUNSADRAFT_2123 [Dunaliella salina]|uniref:Encoded protein n=1 Tax=Dunaliella salina TaxID=3046 RepID=A0ABQ7FWM9_DUNSA|nr:hypothetical protein DUNSADRAFT_2123 [Dunaliella salina]|eukprot:KAF5826753.1 hypothetical protein DUNSADRAFT_2123 [Dunaliella salina]
MKRHVLIQQNHLDEGRKGSPSMTSYHRTRILSTAHTRPHLTCSFELIAFWIFLSAKQEQLPACHPQPSIST